MDIISNLNIFFFLERALDLGMFILIVLYLLFSLVVLRQVFLMSNVIVSGVNNYVKFFAWLHFLFALFLSYFIFVTIIA